MLHMNKTRCYIRNRPSHFLKVCKKLQNLMQNVSGVVEDNLKKARSIMFELCQQFDKDINE